MTFSWLPALPSSEFNSRLAALRTLPAEEALPRMMELANHQIDFVQTNRLDRVLLGHGSRAGELLNRTRPVRLALLGSSTLSHLAPGIRIASLRRGFWVEIFEGQYGAYMQDLADPESALHAFKPEVILLCLDARHVASLGGTSAEQALDVIVSAWQGGKASGASVIQQTVLPVFTPVLGHNEHVYESSPGVKIQQINQGLRERAPAHGVHLLSADAMVMKQGLSQWYDPALWHRAKQEIHPRAAHLFGDEVGRILAAIRGLSYKCLVLDLDNTLWGGVVGDDGVEGIILGQGNATGEAHLDFQRYVKRLRDRGVLLSVCSKNETVHAQSPFLRHPETALRLDDFACFVANWDDKVSNLRSIASTLNIGLDSIVFADDNPFERNLVRQELPMVAVPELSEDPSTYQDIIAAAGYFEAVAVTREDRERAALYAQNAARERVKQDGCDLTSYLRSLDMKLEWSPFNRTGLTRIAQLVNKSNQFNLTTRRYSQEELGGMMANPSLLTLQLRLIDAFGDNGMVAVVIARKTQPDVMEIDTWLMSCRVLGRQVEDATLNLLVERAKSAGVKRLIGCYIPTAKNAMVGEMYPRLGFHSIAQDQDGTTAWELPLVDYRDRPAFIRLVEKPVQEIEFIGAGRDQQPSLSSTH